MVNRMCLPTDSVIYNLCLASVRTALILLSCVGLLTLSWLEDSKRNQWPERLSSAISRNLAFVSKLTNPTKDVLRGHVDIPNVARFNTDGIAQGIGRGDLASANKVSSRPRALTC